jgi:hypothetical protein
MGMGNDIACLVAGPKRLDVFVFVKAKTLPSR